MGPTCELDPELEEAFAGKVGVTTVVVTRVEVNTWPALLVPLENGLGQKKKKEGKGKDKDVRTLKDWWTWLWRHGEERKKRHL